MPENMFLKIPKMKLRHDKYVKIYNLLDKYQIIIYSEY